MAQDLPSPQGTVRRLQSEWAPWPYYDEAQIKLVQETLRSGRVNQWTGEQVFAFENAYAEHLGRKHAVALANGTVALELALRAVGIGEGDEVLTTPRTFIASAGAAVLMGATPVFADVDRDSGNISAATIEEALTERTKAIIVVHLGGWPADMERIMDLARSRNIAVIEDAAQAHGARRKGQLVGSFGDVAAFSFCQDKIITTGGEGGLVAMDEETAWETAWSYKDHGKSFEAVFHRQHDYGFKWLHESFGSNWRMMEMQAALGRYQLDRLEDAVEARNKNARILIEALKPLDAVRVPVVEEGNIHAYYKFYAYLEADALKAGWTRDRIQQSIEEAGVPITSGSCSEIYLEEAFRRAGLTPANRLPVARELGETSLMFQVHPTLSTASVEEAAGIAVEIISSATR